MEPFVNYLIRSVIWLAGFAAVYFLFLRNERFFRLKRYFLIAGILVSFIFPLINIHYQVEVPSPSSGITDLSQSFAAGNTLNGLDNAGMQFDYRIILLFIYLAGIIFLLFRMLLHIRALTTAIGKSDVSDRGDARVVRGQEFSTAFSFFNYVFINPSLSETEAKEIMNHEMVHIRQRHWFDLVLAELLRMIQWMNPFAWIYIAFIRQNHEYLADEAALEKTANPALYRAALVNQLFNSPVISFSNSFNYSLNKKRFDMMKKIALSPYRKLKIFMILPVSVIVFYAFATPEYKYVIPSENAITIYAEPAIIQKVVKGIVVKEDGTPFQKVPILVADTKIRAFTDESGRFSLEGVPENSMLVFSYRGYLTQTIKSEFNKEVKIVLQKDPEYTETPQEVIVENPVSKPGLTFNDAINGPQNALIIINGVPSDRKAMESINPDDILSVGILKGQSATSVFGEKGQNGAIVITTKKAEPITVLDQVITTKSRSQIFSELNDQIAMMRNVPPKEAMEKYGEKGKGGAVEIYTVAKAKELGIKVPFRRRNPEDFPTFQGKSYTSFTDWVAAQVRFPAESAAKGSNGYVRADFTISQDGTVTNVKCTSTPDPLLGETVVKAIQSSPKWEPARNPDATEPYVGNVTLKFVPPDRILSDAAPFVVVEQMPMFPGGDAELLKFIAENTNYPDSARKTGIQGRVIVRFVINKEGGVEDAVVLKGVNPLLDAEAIRVVSMLPKFSPGYQGGKPVSVYYMVPITFTVK